MKPSSKPKLSVIIVCYNNLEVLRGCLTSINKFNDIGEELEVIVVDNGNDNTFDYVRANYQEIIIIKNKNNGFGQANNVGFLASNGEYVLFLNPDTILVEPIFSFTINKFEMNTKLGLFGIKLIDVNKKQNLSFNYIDKHGLVNAQFIKLFHRISFFSPKKMYIVGANLFMRSSVFSEVGMFDENFFMYYEEPDLSRRVKNNGYEIQYFPEKEIIHLEGASSQPNQKMFKIKMDSFRKYCNKYSIDFKKEFSKEYRRTYTKYQILKRINPSKGNEYKLLLEEMDSYRQIVEVGK